MEQLPDENIIMDIMAGFLLALVVLLSATIGFIAAVVIGLLAILPILAVKKIKIYVSKSVPLHRYLGAVFAVFVVAFFAVNDMGMAFLILAIGIIFYLAGIYASNIIAKIVEEKWHI